MAYLAQRETSAAGDLRALKSELHALASECGVYKLDRVLVSLAGRDRVRWLNGMVSNNVRDLAPGNGVYAFVLNAQGQIQGDLYAFNRGESLAIELESMQAPTLLPLLRRYIIMDKVEVEELGDKLTVFGIAGPKSSEVVTGLGLTAPDISLAHSEQVWNGTGVTVVRGDNPSIPNLEFWVPKERTQELWQSLKQNGAHEVHDEALEMFRVLCGIPKIGVDISNRTLPQETGQDRALNFTKGCYIGQEIVERIRTRGAVHRALIGFEVLGLELSPGTAIQVEGKEVGQITSVTRVPSGVGERVVALGSLRKEYAKRELQAGSAKIRAVPLPFSELLQAV